MHDNEVTDHHSWLIRTKWDLPRQQVIHVARRRLVDRLDKVRGRRIAFVIAPAGFGKTTLLAQWCEHRLEKGDRVGWLTLDEDDADAQRFLVYVVFALSAAGVSLQELERLAEKGLEELTPRAVLAKILERIAEEPRPIRLILDDYHRLDSEEVDSLVGGLLGGAPPNFTLIINSRRPPDLDLPRMIASGQALEINAEMLRFSREETRAAIAARLSEEMLDALFNRTEGWAIAVQLARLLLAQDGGDRSVIGHFTGDRGHVAAYLADHVLAMLPEDLQEFLIRTSILERFNAELANSVCGRQDAWEALWRLEHLHALLIPMDSERKWFRFHHLFAEFLQNLLLRKHPELIKELHIRASCWFEKQGYVSGAVAHARLAQDFDRCARLIEAAGGWELILFGGIGYLRNLLGKVPERELDRYPRLQLAKAYLCLKDGEIPASRGLFDAANANPRTDKQDRAFLRDLLNVGTLLGTYEDNWLTPDRYAELISLEDSVAPDDGVTLGVLRCQRALAALGLGRFTEAHEASVRAMRAMQQGQTVLGLNYCYLHAGLAAFYQGRLRLAEQHFREALRMAEENFGADSGLRNAAEVLLAALHYWRGSLNDESEEGFLRALAHVEQNDGWFELYAVGLDIEAGLATDAGDLGRLRNAVERAERIAGSRGMRRLADLAAAHRLRLHNLEGQRSKAEPLACELEAKYGIKCWKSEPFGWKPYQEIAKSLSSHYMGRDNTKSFAYLDDLIACNEAIGSDVYLVSAFVAKADLERHTGRREEAGKSLQLGLNLAIPEEIRRPFCSCALTASLLLNRHACDEKATEGLHRSFIIECLARREKHEPEDKSSSVIAFSPREREVIEELTQGLSNKEIARALDLSENTVKFHLKNIYSKLKVTGRTAAIARASDLSLIY